MTTPDDDLDEMTPDDDLDNLDEPIDRLTRKQKQALRAEFKTIIASLKKLCRKCDRLTKTEKGTARICLGDGELLLMMGATYDFEVGTIWAQANHDRVLASEDAPTGGIFS